MELGSTFSLIYYIDHLSISGIPDWNNDKDARILRLGYVCSEFCYLILCLIVRSLYLKHKTPCPGAGWGGIKEEKRVFILSYIHIENFEAYLMIGKCFLS